MRSDNMPRPFAPTHGEEAESQLQRDIERIDAYMRGHSTLPLSAYDAAWQRIRARLTPDRERVARAIRDDVNTTGLRGEDFWLALADAAIKAMGGSDDA